MDTFEEILRQSGYPLPAQIIRDGRIHRFGDKKACWYVAHEEYGAAGDWKGERQAVKWRANKEYRLPPEIKRQWKAEMAAQRHVWQAEEHEKHLEAAKEAARIFSGGSEGGTSAYLTRKQVTAYGVRFCEDTAPFIAVPVRDVAGTLWSIQKIYEDGTKRFLPGGRKGGCFHVLGRLAVHSMAYLCEGYATGAAVHATTGQAVVICFDAGNIKPVLAALAPFYPVKRWIIAADDDAYGTINTGKVKAEEAAKAFGCRVIIPGFSDRVKQEHRPTDFNDLAVLEGPGAIKKQLSVTAFQKKLVAYTLHDFLSMEIPAREMILAPVIPTQGLAMLYGIRGGGKTYAALSVALAVAAGTGTLGTRWTAPKPRRVVYLDGEMPAVSLQERLAQLSCHLTQEPPEPDYLRIITPDMQENGIPDLSTTDGQKAIDEQLESTELLILDNLSALVRHGKENEAESWVPIQGWLLSLRRRGVSVLIVHHANKTGGQRGTSKKEDLLDTVINLKRPEDYDPQHGAQFAIHYEKARGFHGDEAKPFEARLVAEENGLRWKVKDVEDGDMERVVALAAEGINQRDIGKELGCSAAKVNRLLKKAKAEGKA